MSKADRLPPLDAASGPADHRSQVLAQLEAIIDPCSRNLGTPIGLVGMGLVERLDITGSAIAVELLPTFPTCMFRGVFEEAIHTRLSALPWCTQVSVTFCPADRVWDESRFSAEARRRLGRAPTVLDGDRRDRNEDAGA